MSPDDLSALLTELIALPHESEWVEFKHNNSKPEDIGTWVSALANSAAIAGRDGAYIVWGVEDDTRQPVGTTFQPRRKKVGNEELENWLLHMLDPQIDLRIHEWTHDGQSMVLFEVPRATRQPGPVSARGVHPRRIVDQEAAGPRPVKRPLSGLRSPARGSSRASPPPAGPAAEGTRSDRLHELFPAVGSPAADQSAGIPRPPRPGETDRRPAGRPLRRHQPRGGSVRPRSERLRPARPQDAANHQVPRRRPFGSGTGVGRPAPAARLRPRLRAGRPISSVRCCRRTNRSNMRFREQVLLYPRIAIRELVANALIHQDFSVTGTGPLVEIFARRMEITNPGEPLVDTDRFIDTPPRSRNEQLAALMRRMKICEEARHGDRQGRQRRGTVPIAGSRFPSRTGSDAHVPVRAAEFQRPRA